MKGRPANQSENTSQRIKTEGRKCEKPWLNGRGTDPGKLIVGVSFQRL